MATPTRAVRLVALDSQPDPDTFGGEQVDAYRAVEKVATIERTVSKLPIAQRNAAAEAAARVFAARNFR